MPTQAPSLDRLFQLEEHLESGFVDLLSKGEFATPFSSRSDKTMNSPYVSIVCTNGAVQQHQYVRGNIKIWDSFSGTLVTEIVTNRISERGNADKNHVKALGIMRKWLQLYNVQRYWDRENYLQIYDIREDLTIDTWVDEDSLDHSQISWLIWFRIMPWAFPANLLD